MTIITIINYGLGNIRSVQKAFERVGYQVKISSNKDDIIKSDKLVLPGVGHFAKGIENLNNLNLYDTINEAVLIKKKIIIGICLGMQLMTKHSTEGNLEGLGWIDAVTKKFDFKNNSLKIPHMGWNNIVMKKGSVLLREITDEDFFYFVHSYFVQCNENEDILFTTNYGIDFVSGFQKENIFGVQFHPEKSHDAGLKILKNFAEL